MSPLSGSAIEQQEDADVVRATRGRQPKPVGDRYLHRKSSCLPAAQSPARWPPVAQGQWIQPLEPNHD
ncbi:MAG: hypothetical protein U0175_07755 [Caldilineaceae bacterium]